MFRMRGRHQGLRAVNNVDEGCAGAQAFTFLRLPFAHFLQGAIDASLGARQMPDAGLGVKLRLLAFQRLHREAALLRILDGKRRLPMRRELFFHFARRVLAGQLALLECESLMLLALFGMAAVEPIAMARDASESARSSRSLMARTFCQRGAICCLTSLKACSRAAAYSALAQVACPERSFC